MSFGDIPLRLATTAVQNIAVSDIIKRHTMNKDTRVCIEMYGVARGFPVRDLGEGPLRPLALQNDISH